MNFPFKECEECLCPRCNLHDCFCYVCHIVDLMGNALTEAIKECNEFIERDEDHEL
jgi:hypothetical protein